MAGGKAFRVFILFDWIFSLAAPRMQLTRASCQIHVEISGHDANGTTCEPGEDGSRAIAGLGA